jgi:putative spermidine/putrescine transport system ATP-binding protein
VIEPPLVLMDEPLSNLDAKLRLEMRAEIRRIHDLVGSTTIYVTHDQDEALSLADRIVVMRDGQVRQVGVPEDLYARPAHADVAAFMGFRNQLPGQLLPGATVRVKFGTAEIDGIAAGGLDSAAKTAIVAIRPDDLTPRPDGVLAATVQAAEYRGRDFYGIAAMEDGTELYFRADGRVAPGEKLHLGADPARVLVYPGGAA